jgi:hypothetical protein
MSFKSILDTLGSDTKKVFIFLGSSKGQAIVDAGEAVVETIEPQTTAFFTLANNWLAEILKTQALATAAGAASGSNDQKTAIALSSITPQVLAFAQQYGLNTPTATELATANAALVTFFNVLGATVATTAVTPTANPTPVTNASL